MPVAVLEVVPYPDGSLMFVEVSFPVTLPEVRTHQYWLEAAPEGRQAHYRYDPEAGLPTLEFSLVENDGSATTDINLPVGELMVRVEEHPELYYYWYLIPIGAILGLLIWRKVHLR